MDLREYLLARKFGGGSGNGTWGSITGTLSDQTDLQDALNAKLDTSKVYNGLDQTSSGYALDARQGKAIADGYIPIANNAGFHNSIFRGKYLGSSVTADQYDAIDAGTFEDLFIGDYWTINDVNWRIAAFDYWLNTGDSGKRCNTHHVVIVPDTVLATCKMNSTNIVTGAYTGSDFYTGNNSNTGKSTAVAAINNAFSSSHILSHRENLSISVNTSSGTRVNNMSWYDAPIELMSELMVFGYQPYSNAGTGTTIPVNWNTAKTQFQLFMYCPEYITIGATYWLRDVADSQRFAVVHADGVSTMHSATDNDSVRPVFAICKEASA